MIYTILGDYNTYIIGYGPTYEYALKFAYEYNDVEEIIDDITQAVMETNRADVDAGNKLDVYRNFLESDFLVSVVKMDDSARAYLEAAMQGNGEVDLDDFEEVGEVYYPKV